MAVTIRAATPDDAAALAELRWEFRSGLNPPVEDRGPFVARCADWMRRELGPSGGWRAWLAAADDGAISGAIWMHMIAKVPNPVGERDRHAYVSNLFVKPAARGGVGTKLLEAVLEWTEAHGIDRVVLWPTAGSRSLYRRYGFTFNGDVMERKNAEPKR